jgi:hypothetical protein
MVILYIFLHQLEEEKEEQSVYQNEKRKRVHLQRNNPLIHRHQAYKNLK